MAGPGDQLFPKEQEVASKSIEKLVTSKLQSVSFCYLQMKFIITTIFSIAFLNSADAKSLEIEDYCNYKQSASHVTINLPITLKYKDGTSFAKYLFISCSKGRYCSGFITGGGASIRAANGGTWVLDELTVKHMGKDSVVLVSGINEFLLDVPTKLFRWTENSSTGGIAEYRCSKIFSE